MAFLSEYHFELNDIKGKENKIVDALSRRAYMIYEVTLSRNPQEIPREQVVSTTKRVKGRQKRTTVVQGDILRFRRRGYSVQHPHGI